MATDATGTPTTLGIPTYDVNIDAPSGNGFNAAMAEIDTLLQQRATLASPVFTGTPAAPTPAPGDNDTSIATTAFVTAALALLMPSGSVVPYAGASAPAGYLLADGSAVSRSTYATLFSAIGTAYGAGDGSTTFNLPNLKGRVPVGKNTGTFSTLGATGGEETHLLAVAEIPAHTHQGSGTTSGQSTTHTHNYTEPVMGNVGTGVSASAAVGTSIVATSTPSSDHSHTYSFTTDGGAGTGGSAHNNLQPYQVLNYIVKT